MPSKLLTQTLSLPSTAIPHGKMRPPPLIGRIGCRCAIGVNHRDRGVCVDELRDQGQGHNLKQRGVIGTVTGWPNERGIRDPDITETIGGNAHGLLDPGITRYRAGNGVDQIAFAVEGEHAVVIVAGDPGISLQVDGDVKGLDQQGIVHVVDRSDLEGGARITTGELGYTVATAVGDPDIAIQIGDCALRLANRVARPLKAPMVLAHFIALAIGGNRRAVRRKFRDSLRQLFHTQGAIEALKTKVSHPDISIGIEGDAVAGPIDPTALVGSAGGVFPGGGKLEYMVVATDISLGIEGGDMIHIVVSDPGVSILVEGNIAGAGELLAISMVCKSKCPCIDFIVRSEGRRV